MASSSHSVPLERGPISSFDRRGLISCLHSRHCRTGTDDSTLLPDKDLPPAVHKLIVGFYQAAFNRLPCDALPDLLRLLTTDGGGSCIGLLDPVSNIILNTLALLPYHKAAAAAAAQAASTTSSPPAKRRTRSQRGVALNTRPVPGLGAWCAAASKSYSGLYGFLMAYFGCLTKKQAIRYLYRASANLPLAVKLVLHDMYFSTQEEAIDPKSDRAQAALEWAANVAGHPSPTTLAQLMAIQLQDGDFGLLRNQLSGSTPLTAENVRAIHRMLHRMMSPCVAAISHTKKGLEFHIRQNLEAQCSGKGSDPVTSADATTISTTTFDWRVGTPISSLQLDLPKKLQDCLKLADEQKDKLKTPCGGDACDYLQSLKMYLHGMIHNLYIKALKLLPTPSGLLMHAILKAGHCYGCMDPLSNIIVNSIWFSIRASDTPEIQGSTRAPLLRRRGRTARGLAPGVISACNIPLSDHRNIAGYNDVLDPLSLLRIQVQSLEGLTKLAAFADRQFPVPACALEFLCSAKCDIVNMLPPSSDWSEENPFHEAAKAAGHPRPLGLGELHQLLLQRPDVRSKLLSFITEAKTGPAVLRLEEMTTYISDICNRPEVQAVQAPELDVKALRKVAGMMRSEYEGSRIWFRSKIERLLKEYTDNHFWEPQYKLDTIIGVEQSNKGSSSSVAIPYYVNFMATSDLGIHRILFFAAFWSFSPEPRPEFCCPLPYEHAGRCYYGVHSARKIVYPDDAKYIPQDITHNGTSSVNGMLGMDLVYLSPQLDVELAENVEKEVSESKRRRVK